MDKQTLEALIADDDLGLLDVPKLTNEEWAMVEAFSSFILKQLGRG